MLIDLTLKNKGLYTKYTDISIYLWPHLTTLFDAAELLTAPVCSLLIGAHGPQFIGRSY